MIVKSTKIAFESHLSTCFQQNYQQLPQFMKTAPQKIKNI